MEMCVISVWFLLCEWLEIWLTARWPHVFTNSQQSSIVTTVTVSVCCLSPVLTYRFTWVILVIDYWYAVCSYIWLPTMVGYFVVLRKLMAVSFLVFLTLFSGVFSFFSSVGFAWYSNIRPLKRCMDFRLDHTIIIYHFHHNFLPKKIVTFFFFFFLVPKKWVDMVWCYSDWEKWSIFCSYIVHVVCDT